MRLLPLFLLIVPALATITFRRSGWLDRVVEYTREKFLNDLIASATFEVEVQTPPPGYKDSEEWDFESVQRLLRLIYATESAKPVRRMLERSLAPSRRYGIPHSKSLVKIPSLAAAHPGFFYDYEETGIEPDFSEDPDPWRILKDDETLFISNPVESHLPSRHISVGHIREILTQRSFRARILPTKATANFTWLPPTPPRIVSVHTNIVPKSTAKNATETGSGNGTEGVPPDDGKSSDKDKDKGKDVEKDKDKEENNSTGKDGDGSGKDGGDKEKSKGRGGGGGGDSGGL